MSRKDYVALAGALARGLAFVAPAFRETVAVEVGYVLKADNARFDEEKFLTEIERVVKIINPGGYTI